MQDQAWIQFFITPLNFLTRVFVTLTLTNLHTWNPARLNTNTISHVLFLGIKLTLSCSSPLKKVFTTSLAVSHGSESQIN